MEYTGSGLNLKSLMDEGEEIPTLEYLGKAIAQFHNSSMPISNNKLENELLMYKIDIQYDYSLFDASLKEKELYVKLYDELFSSKTSFATIHGDLNSKNIIVGENGQLGVIDFEHSGIGKRIYDLSYLVADLLISAIIYQEEELYRNSINEFLLSYLNISTQPISELDSLWGHVAVQLLYRLKGPSSSIWTGCFS